MLIYQKSLLRVEMQGLSALSARGPASYNDNCRSPVPRAIRMPEKKIQLHNLSDHKAYRKSFQYRACNLPSLVLVWSWLTRTYF